MNLSVIDEMCLRLRNAGLWDNSLGDSLSYIISQIKKLEEWSQYEITPGAHIRRPLQTWDDCKNVLVALSASRWSSFSDIAAPVEACLTLAVLLYYWKEKGMPVPSDIRGMMHGAICVEWKTPKYDFVIIDKNGLSFTMPKEQ